ncbi:PilN domain-containing protein [Phormidesmis sp. 146-12]
MYSLDINFLNDRPEYKPDGARRGTRPRTATFASSDRRPLYWGLAAGVFFPVVMLALWGILQAESSKLTTEQAELDSQLGNLEQQKKELAAVNEQIKQTTDETQALATVFNQIKPWSAMAQDIRDRLPPGVQVTAIKQVAPPTTGAAAQPAPSPAAGGAQPAPPVSGVIQITGLANSFNDVNDFILTLQRSNFMQSDKTRLLAAKLGTPGTLQSLNFPGSTPGGGSRETPKLPPQVEFSIETALNEVPASELIRELERKGAVGLVTRIDALKDKGVIKP